MERDVKEIIKRNREALGLMGSGLFDDLLIDSLAVANGIISIATLMRPDATPVILADGLIVAYDVREGE